MKSPVAYGYSSHKKSDSRSNCGQDGHGWDLIAQPESRASIGMQRLWVEKAGYG